MKRKNVLLRVGEQIWFYSNLMSKKISAVITDIFWRNPNGETMHFEEEPGNISDRDLMIELLFNPPHGFLNPPHRQRTTAFDIKKAILRQAANN